MMAAHREQQRYTHGGIKLPRSSILLPSAF
jgi:hypothetical protein